MNLKDFPRPPNDNGRGMHFALDNRQSDLDAFLPVLCDMGVRWVLFYVGDELQAQRCAQAAWSLGIMPVMRAKLKIGQQFPWEAAVSNVNSVIGAPSYWQIFNEPGNKDEWQSGSYNADRFAQLWHQAADRVLSVGGLPGLQTLDQVDVQKCFTGYSDKVWFASHAYQSNHPSSYPYDDINQNGAAVTLEEYNQHGWQGSFDETNKLRWDSKKPGSTIFDDDTCQLRFIEEAEWCKQAFGFYCPVIVTEGGAVMGQSEDARYPRTDEGLHQQYSLEVYNQFRGKLANGQDLPDYIFAYCPFLIFGVDWWAFSWIQSAPKTIQAIKDLHSNSEFVRKFSWDNPNPEPIMQRKFYGIYVTPNGRPSIDEWKKYQWCYAVSMDHDPEYWKAVLQVSPKTEITGRHWFEDQNLLVKEEIAKEIASNQLGLLGQSRKDIVLKSKAMIYLAMTPQDSFNAMLPDMQKMKGIYKRWMRFNEIGTFSQADAEKYNNSELEWMKICDANGYKCAILSNSEGHPDISLIKFFVPAFKYAIGHGHTYNRHEYDWQIWRTQPWRALRATLEMEELRKAGLIIPDGFVEVGEGIIDGGVAGVDQPQKGWRHFTNEDGFIENLQWYVTQIAKYSFYRVVALFAWMWDVTDTFNLAGANKVLEFTSREFPVTIQNLTDVQRAQIIVNQEFPRPDVALAISLAENPSGNPTEINDIGNNPPTSVDRGLWMINNHWHSEVSDSCAFDPTCSTKEAFRISKDGTDFSQWSVWSSETNNYREKLPRAQEALRHVIDPVLQAAKQTIAAYPPIKLPMPINDQAWLDKFSMSNGLGCAETPEIEFTVSGKIHIVQERARAYAIMVKGDNSTARSIWK